MNRGWSATIVSFALLAPATLWAHGEAKSPHGHHPSAAEAQVCAAGCAAKQHFVQRLSDEELHAWLEAYGSDPLGEATVALETLLFHGDQVREHLAAHAEGLDAEHLAALGRELATTHVRIELRLVNEDGTERARLDGARVQLGERSHLAVTETLNLQPFGYSGTVRRVGLKHLWGRL